MSGAKIISGMVFCSTNSSNYHGAQAGGSTIIITNITMNSRSLFIDFFALASIGLGSKDVITNLLFTFFMLGKIIL
jgi:hypothetical protein